MSRLDRQQLLQGYISTVLFRDIVERFGVTNIAVLKTLIRHIIRNAGSKFSVNKFYNHLKSEGFRVGKTTLHEYLDHLQDAFLLYRVPIYTDSERRRMVNPAKVYVNDSGLAASYSFKQNHDLGHFLENAVFMELRRRYAKVTYGITPSGFEVDYLVEYPDGTSQAIQVAADVSDPSTRNRECGALVEASAILPGAEILLTNLSEKETIERNGVIIELVPAWKWLLADH